jgi:hypothetical protein
VPEDSYMLHLALARICTASGDRPITDAHR